MSSDTCKRTMSDGDDRVSTAIDTDAAPATVALAEQWFELGAASYERGESAAALTQYHRALALFTATVGEQHVETAAVSLAGR